MDQVLQGLPGIACYIDDILVTGRTDEEHMRNLEAVFKRLRVWISIEVAEMPVLPGINGVSWQDYQFRRSSTIS